MKIKWICFLTLIGGFVFSFFSLLNGATAPVKVWEGKMVLPTYEEGLPDVNPPFDFFQGRAFITYPYTTRENLTDRKAEKSWRTLNLENELLRVVVLPDLGGRLYSCVDKANGREMFYANPSIKYAQVVFRGAWVALGIEFNFPVSHNWMTVSPVDFGTVQEPDGGASIWVGNIDRPYGMMWRVALTLYPGSSLLEQTITLHNSSDLRHRFYWWNTGSVEVQDDSRIIYPMEFSASHGFKDVDSWPVDSSGLDLSIPANHTRGFVSRFAHATREPFMGVYHPKTQSGVAHFAEIEQVPAKKIWSWGWDDEGKDWRRALSDNESAYLEVQAGLFRNQETYAFLEPQQFLRFKEYWMPIRGIGGFSLVNRNGAIRLERSAGSKGGINLQVGLNVTRDVSDGHLILKAGEKTLSEEPLALEASGEFQKQFADLENFSAYTVELVGAGGEVLLAHTENLYNRTPKNEVKTGPMPSYRVPPPQERTEGDWLEWGRNLELTGKVLQAYDCYQGGLRRFPKSIDLHKAAGRLAVQLKRFLAAEEHQSKVVAQISNDGEALYYLGNAYWFLGKRRDARIAWESAALLPAFRPAALLQLARLASQEGKLQQALAEVHRALVDSPRLLRAGCMEVTLLRHLGKGEEAKTRLAYWQTIDPPNSFLRVENGHWKGEEESLWRHLAGDPERVLEIAVEYLKLGFYQDTVELLARQYPQEGVQAEPGAVLPQHYPLVAYYRGYCREKLGAAGKEDFQLARQMSTRFVFPNRSETMAVLELALKSNPADGLEAFLRPARFRYYLGNLNDLCGRPDLARKHWQDASQSREPRQAPFAFLAAKRLGAMDSTAWEKRLGSALEDVKDYIAGGGHFPGSATFSQGMILELLGRREESAEQLRQVFYLPDKGMSHYLARQALRTEPKEGF